MRHDVDLHRTRHARGTGRAGRRRAGGGGLTRGTAAAWLLMAAAGGATIGVAPVARGDMPAITIADTAPTTAGAVRFGLCHSGGGANCVVDGDTFWMAGEKIRIADIDTPETHPPRCAEEARLGAAATARLHALLNAGPFTLQPIDRDTDRYGRKLRVVMRGGESLGGLLVDEGLARWYGNGRRGWCG